MLNGDKRNERTASFSALIKKHPDTLLLAVTMLLLILSKLILSAFVGSDVKYSIAAIILSLFCFVIPSLVYLYLCHFKVGDGIPNVRLKVPSLISTPTVISAVVLMITGAMLIVLLGTGGGNFTFSIYSSFELGKEYSFGAVLLMMIAYALIPAVCEEFLFRGVFCAVYERHGLLPSAFLSTLFFTLIHLNVTGFPVFMFAGIILWLLLYSTSSLYVTIGAHFIYNLFCLFGLPYINAYYGDSLEPDLFVFLVTVLFLVSASAFCICNAWIYKRRGKKGDTPKYNMTYGGTAGLQFIGKELLSAGALVSLVIYVIYAFAA